ncbi:hypothetical protein R3P38DRAFT_3556825 [Favolaschia claudopus]|uniref:Uncharacterized protein n=1 Tax=Favolaschia claudopus TaxID=2862362 RepID=A0AAW0B124_9AGAR
MPTTRNSIASPDHIACARNTRFHRPSDYPTVSPRPADSTAGRAAGTDMYTLTEKGINPPFWVTGRKSSDVASIRTMFSAAALFRASFHKSRILLSAVDLIMGSILRTCDVAFNVLYSSGLVVDPLDLVLSGLLFARPPPFSSLAFGILRVKLIGSRSESRFNRLVLRSSQWSSPRLADPLTHLPVSCLVSSPSLDVSSRLRSIPSPSHLVSSSSKLASFNFSSSSATLTVVLVSVYVYVYISSIVYIRSHTGDPAPPFPPLTFSFSPSFLSSHLVSFTQSTLPTLTQLVSSPCPSLPPISQSHVSFSRVFS